MAATELGHKITLNILINTVKSTKPLFSNVMF